MTTDHPAPSAILSGDDLARNIAYKVRDCIDLGRDWDATIEAVRLELAATLDEAVALIRRISEDDEIETIRDAMDACNGFLATYEGQKP